MMRGDVEVVSGIDGGRDVIVDDDVDVEARS